MKIDIFKHVTVHVTQPGVPVLIPGTPYCLTSYPTKCVLQHLEETKSYEYPIDTVGPVRDFVVRADLERSSILVEGHGASGFFRVPIPQKSKPLQKQPRLSFGRHRSLNWSQVIERDDVLEMIPLLFTATMGYPLVSETEDSLLKNLQDAVAAQNRTAVFPMIRDLMRSGMQGVFVPTQIDVWGYPQKMTSLSPTQFLGALHNAIQSIFLQENKGVISILPLLPPEATCGRLIDVSVAGCTIHIEWTKHKLRRVFLEIREAGTFKLQFPEELKRFRLRDSKSDKGQLLEVSESLALQVGKLYYFDHFE